MEGILERSSETVERKKSMCIDVCVRVYLCVQACVCACVFVRECVCAVVRQNSMELKEVEGTF